MNDFTKMTRKEQVAYWVGTLCLAIGKGKFNEEVSLMMDFYQREAYERGIEAGKKQIQKAT